MERITIDDELCNGKPTIRGLRITVQAIVEFLLSGTSDEEILYQYPVLEKEDLEACRRFTTRMMERSFSVRDLAA